MDIDILIQEVELLKATIVILGNKVYGLETEIGNIKSEARKKSPNICDKEDVSKDNDKSKESEVKNTEKVLETKEIRPKIKYKLN